MLMVVMNGSQLIRMSLFQIGFSSSQCQDETRSNLPDLADTQAIISGDFLISLVIGKRNHFVLAFRTPNLVNENTLIYIFLIISKRLKRIRKPKVIQKTIELLSIVYPPKNVSRTIKANILIPVIIKLLLRLSKLDKLFLIYTLPFQIKKK